MTRQWAVVVRPDLTMNVELIGPFRSRVRALDVLAKVDVFDEAEPMLDIDGQEVPRLAEIVELDRWGDVKGNYAVDAETNEREKP